jgi:hypothetical protein
MTDRTDVTTQNTEDAADFEYDSAHEATGGRQATGGHHREVQLQEEPDGGDGDYGYDTAHDMWRQ